MPLITPVAGASDVAALIARLERTAVFAVLGGTVLLGLAFGWRMGAGVLAGGCLSAISYRALARGVAAIGPPPAGQEDRPPPSPVRVALGLVGRYALLLAGGYVIIARLHLHPLGVLVGVSAVVIAAMVETARAWR
ncbi:MAG TPA: ATP synthase subunit I [Luteitalea sp.]|nr:ATP synthase subunit I [Luteitalea sp.]